MSRDTWTTIGGLVLVGAVVVATFLYGSQQRQDQTRNDQNIARQNQPARSDSSSKSQAGSQASNQPAASSQSSEQQPAVSKPNAGDKPLQGGHKDEGQAAAASDATGQGAGSPVIANGATETPKTGGEIAWLAGLAMVGLLVREYRRSRQSLRRALRS